MRDWRFWALLSLFALVTGLYVALPRLDSDQAVTGLMGLHILRGEFPIFFWRQDHAGVPESYGAAVTFALFGVSRVTLSLVPMLSALGLLLVVYRTGAVLFGHRTGLLAMLFLTVTSPYVASHYLLARGYYIEHLLLGSVILLGAAMWLARPLGEAARTRILIAMGLAGGVGLYCGFQIVDALAPAGLAVLLVDPLLMVRRGFWLGAGAFLLGGAPFWVYNLTHDWATLATGARFQGRHSGAEAARVIVTDLLPVILGVREYTGSPAYLPGPLAFVSPTIVVVAVLILAARVARHATRVRRDPLLAGEALLLSTVVVTLGVVWYGRYVLVPRYLLFLGPLVALILARACQLTWGRSRSVAVVATAAYLAAVGTGLVRDLTVFWPAGRAAYWASRAEDESLLRFLRERGLTRVYAFEYWLAPRLTFDAREEIIVALPDRDRNPAYTRAVDLDPRPAYVTDGPSETLERWMTANQIGVERTHVGRYAIYGNFTAPPPAVPLPRMGWALRTTPGIGGPEQLVDGQIESGWMGHVSSPRRIEVDVGARRAVSGVTLIADHPRHLPQLLVVSIDGRPVARVETGGVSVVWRNQAPRTVPDPALTVRFPPVEARQLVLEDRGRPGPWVVSELFLLGPPEAGVRAASELHPPERSPPLLEAGPRREGADALGPALVRYRETMRGRPDDPEAYAEFTRLAVQARLLEPAPPGTQAARYARAGLVDRARMLYARLGETLGDGLIHAELVERQAALAAAEGATEEAARLQAQTRAVLAPPRRVATVFGWTVEVLGYDVPVPRARPGEDLDVRLYWRLLGPPSAPIAAYLRFRGDHYRFTDDRPLPAPIPGLGSGPQHILVRRRITVPADAPPGRYRLRVGVWDPASGQQYRHWWRGLVPSMQHTVELGAVEVLPRS